MTSWCIFYSWYQWVIYICQNHTCQYGNNVRSISDEDNSAACQILEQAGEKCEISKDAVTTMVMGRMWMDNQCPRAATDKIGSSTVETQPSVYQLITNKQTRSKENKYDTVKALVAVCNSCSMEYDLVCSVIGTLTWGAGITGSRNEGNILFNDALNAF